MITTSVFCDLCNRHISPVTNLEGHAFYLDIEPMITTATGVEVKVEVEVVKTRPDLKHSDIADLHICNECIPMLITALKVVENND